MPKIDIINKAKEVLQIERDALSYLINKINGDFEKAIDLILSSKGRVIVTGMGKPGLIGRKISATLASTGTPSLYLHPAEAIHGDLGMILREDVVIAISNSGETEEIIKLIPLIKRIGCKLIAMSGNTKSTLAKNSDILLDVGVEKEACCFGLAPTSSTTAALAMGDAIAVVLACMKNFKAEDYALLHPGGELGRKLMIKVSEVMRKGKNNPTIIGESSIEQAIDLVTSAKAGAVTIVDDNGCLLGVFTDGDLRRLCINPEKRKKDISKIKLKEVMTVNPRYINKDQLAVEALRLMQDKRIDELPVVDDNNKVVGMLDVQDLLKMGLV
ncbi:KpsF/GutQ family sugar-phosphate isomerase [bacterium]|nr:KpsF/GutQ family sugar-phosphate isomerase [bacterium]